MFFKISVILLLCLLNISCTIIGKIPIPGAHVNLESLWIKMIERRVVYRSVEYSIPEFRVIAPYVSEIYEDNTFFIINRIHTSRKYSYKRVPIGKIYFNYSEPFSFHIQIRDLNGNIEKIILRQCFMITENNEIRNFMTLSQYADWYEPVKTDLIIEKDKITDAIYLNFHNIPINYQNEKEIIIVYEFDVFLFNEMKTIRHEIKYMRLFEEYIHNRGKEIFIPENDRIWQEINEKEWGKYL